MKKVFKKMKKRLSGDGNKKIDRALSKSDRSRSSDSSQAQQQQPQQLDGSNASNSERIKEAPKASSPSIIHKETISEEDTAASAPSTNSTAPAPAPAPAPPTSPKKGSDEKKKEDPPKKNQNSSSGDKKEANKKDSSNAAGGSKDKNDKPGNDDPSEAFETYSDVPALDSIKLPRGGISIETKAVGRIQVRIRWSHGCVVCSLPCQLLRLSVRREIYQAGHMLTTQLCYTESSICVLTFFVAVWVPLIINSSGSLPRPSKTVCH